MTRTIILLSVFMVLFTNCGKDKGNDSKSSCTQSENAQTLTHDNETREYVLYVPDSYDGSSAVPLMFNFHGYGGNAREYMDYANMSDLAESEIFILVYPQGSCSEGNSHWNPSLPSSDNKSTADDFGFIEALINDLSSDYNIDSERIYACGYSNGGMLAYGLGCYKSNLMAAVGSVSGTMLDFDCSPSHPMPIINIHGTSDGVLPYNGSSDYSSVETIINYWNGLNNTNATPIVNSVDDNGTTIEHYIYTDGDSSISVEHYKVIEGDHVWFDMNYQGNNTSQLIWDFVSKYDINGLR